MNKNLLKKRIVTLLTAFSLVISAFGGVSFATEDDDTSPVVEKPVTEPMFSLPDNLRATVITPSVDFPADEKTDELTVNTALDTVFATISDMGMNAVVINTVYDGASYYINELNTTVKVDFVGLALKKAQDYGLKVYMMFDMGYVLGQNNSAKDDIDYIISEIHKFTLRYMCDGIVLDDYYSVMSTDSFTAYMHDGSGVGYENWLYDRTSYFIETMSSIIHITDNSVPVGINITDVWANKSDEQDSGSQTTAEKQALYDGFSDTKSLIESGAVDFAFVHANGSITDSNTPYETVTAWWENICSQSGVSMYVVHHNEFLGETGHDGWFAEDQLLKQLSVSKTQSGYCGSIFNSYASLAANTVNSADTLKSFYADEINEDTLFDELKMTLPKKNTFTTGDSTVVFAGTFDENFEVYLNGYKIKLNEAGNFYIEKDLVVGTNYFNITHKSKTYYYTIERKVVTLKSIDNSIGEGKTLKVDGGTKISLSAIAYKGADVTVTLGTTTVALKQRSTALEDDETNSSYAKFTGSIVVPDSIVGSEQSLGQLAVTAAYGGYSKTMYGASVFVNAGSGDTNSDINSHLYDNQDTIGTGEVVGTMDATHSSSESVTYIRTNSDYTFVYDAKTTGSVLTPNFGQLPATTLDYYKSSTGSYYLSESGRRYNPDAVTIVDGQGMGENNLVVKSVGTSGGDSFIKILMDKHASYNVEVIGNTYYSGYEGDYYMDSFDATHVYITFDNITSVTKLPSFKYNLVFSSGKWDTVKVNGVPKFRLILKLRQPQVYAGNGAYYNSDGELMLTFQVPQNTISAMTVVIDPGHGYGRSATVFDPGAVGEVVEQEVNLAVAEKLTEKLKALGCNAVRLKTESEYLLTVLRPTYARQYGCDLYIALHANQTDGSTVRGTEVYFFTSFSQPLAKAICDNISSYFTNSVYSDGANKNRGAKYSYFWVTEHQDFPSVLVEMGFVNNLEDAMAMGTAKGQDGIAQAIVNGILQYISRSTISYSEDGNEEIPVDDPAQTTEQTTAATFSDITNEPPVSTSPEITLGTDSATIPETSLVPVA